MLRTRELGVITPHPNQKKHIKLNQEFEKIKKHLHSERREHRPPRGECTEKKEV